VAANPDETIHAIAERLQALRAAMGYGQNQRGFALFVGVTITSWNNYERAFRRIDIDNAIKVAKATGAPLDWIYRGVRTALPHDLALRLAEVELRLPKRA
jgi:transcriptional regulator with XRE-family HTH domain